MIENNGKMTNFEKNTLIVFVLSMLANVTNGLFQIFSGKLLGTSDYGQVTVINSYVTYLGVFTGPIATMACCYSAKLYCKGTEKIAGFIRWIIKYSLAIEILVSMIGFCTAFFLKGIIEEDIFKTMIFVVLLLPSNSFYLILLSIIQGMQTFTLHGVIGVVFYGIKAAAGIALMLMGWGTFGVVLAMLLSQLVCVFICFWVLRKYLVGNIEKASYGHQELLQFYGSIFLLQVFYFFYIYGGEIIVLNLFFENSMVGEYSAAAMLCKFLFYAVTPITTVLLPNVAEKKSRGEDTFRILKKAMIYVFLLVLCFGAGVWLFGEKVLLLFYGNEYVNAVKYLPAAFLYTVMIIFLSIMYSYHTAIANTKKMTISLIVLSSVMVVGLLGVHDEMKTVLMMISVLLGVADIYSYALAGKN